jgi:hypothetical protein
MITSPHSLLISQAVRSCKKLENQMQTYHSVLLSGMPAVRRWIYGRKIQMQPAFSSSRISSRRVLRDLASAKDC